MTQKKSNFCDLSGQRALVTGASSGIGRAIALELAAAGADVIVHYARSEAKAHEVCQKVRQLGQRSESMKLEFPATDYDAFVAQAWQLWDGLDIWVNNAGADLLTGPQAKLPYADKLQLLWDVDVHGAVDLSKAVLGRMKSVGHGVILTIGWDQADRGMEGDSAELFSVAKNAVMGFTRSLALTAAPEVRVNCIAPGWIQTAWGDQVRQEWHDRVIRETPLARWGQPQDIANMARFLCSDEAAYLTGQVMNVNGGAIR